MSNSCVAVVVRNHARKAREREPHPHNRVLQSRRCAECGREYRPRSRGARQSKYCRPAHRERARRRALRCRPEHSALARALGYAISTGLSEPGLAALRAEIDRLYPPSPQPRSRRALAKREPRTKKLPWPRYTPDGRLIGIDVAARLHEIRKLLIAGRFHVPGHAPEDLLQQICLVILRRNEMPSAFDPRKGCSFGHYIHMIARNECANLATSPKSGREALSDTGEGYDLADEATPLERFEESPLWRG